MKFNLLLTPNWRRYLGKSCCGKIGEGSSGPLLEHIEQIFVEDIGYKYFISSKKREDFELVG